MLKIQDLKKVYKKTLLCRVCLFPWNQNLQLG